MFQKGVAPIHANEQKTGLGGISGRLFLLKLNHLFPFPLDPVPKCNLSRERGRRGLYSPLR